MGRRVEPRSGRACGALGSLLLPFLASAVAAQSEPLPRPLGPVLARAAVPLGRVERVIPMSDGRLYVNDPGYRRLLILTPDLGNHVVVLDSVLGRDNSYGSTRRVVFPFMGDSALFHDATAGVLVVISPAGKPVRTIAPPPGTNVPTFLNPFGENIGPPRAFPWFTEGAGLLYMVETRYSRPAGIPPGVAEIADTSWRDPVILRFDPATRSVDTTTRVMNGSAMIYGFTGRASFSRMLTPFYPFVDEVALLSDGTLAVVRARDYRLELFANARSPARSVRLPHEWRRLDESARQALADSVNAVRHKEWETRVERWVSDSTAVGGAGPTEIIVQTLVSGERRNVPRAIPRPPPPPQVRADEFPDFLPPFRPGSVVADADNRLWIARETVAPDGSARYDVIDSGGNLVDRVLVPSGATIVGFAPGAVFLSARDAGVTQLLKLRIAR